jgi:hypothetical protein
MLLLVGFVRRAGVVVRGLVEIEKQVRGLRKRTYERRLLRRPCNSSARRDEGGMLYEPSMIRMRHTEERKVKNAPSPFTIGSAA